MSSQTLTLGVALLAVGLFGCTATPKRAETDQRGVAESQEFEVSLAALSSEEFETVLAPAPEAARALRSKGLLSLESQRTSIRKRSQSRDILSRIDWADTSWLPPKAVDELRVHFLPVGAGSCHLVECPGVDALPMIIDCGSGIGGGSQINVASIRKYLAAFLPDLFAKIVVTHQHYDHYSLLPSLFRANQVHSLWMGGFEEAQPEMLTKFADGIRSDRPASDPGVSEPFEINWHNDGYAVQDLSCGDAPTFILTVNNVAPDDSNNLNDRSLMLSIDHGDFRVLFSGDATGVVQDAAIRNYPGDLLVSTVLAAPHHGATSHESNSERWAEAVYPAYVVYSSGSKWGHPRCEAVDRYRASLVTVAPHTFSCDGGPVILSGQAEYSTHQSGAIVITSDASLETLRVNCNPGPC